MEKVNVREARERIAQLLDAVAAGEEVMIIRRGRPAARMVRIESEQVSFPERAALRNELPPMKEPAGETVRSLRDDERY